MLSIFFCLFCWSYKGYIIMDYDVFFDVSNEFSKKFGRVFIWGHGTGFFYETRNKENKALDLNFLKDEEIIELMEKSIKNDIDYLYEKAKNHPVVLNPNCLYQQNHEDNIELIKSKYKETGLKLFHNEKGEALGLASIDIIKEHKWFVNGVRSEDKRAFLDDLHKVNGRALYILAKHAGDMQVEFYSTYNGSFYSPKENKIYCNLIKDSNKKDNQVLEFKLGMRTFLHEAGHWLDSNIHTETGGLREEMSLLSAYIAKDVLTYINKMGYSVIGSGYKPMNANTISQLPENLQAEVIKMLDKNKYINSNISDLYGAMTANRISTGIGHENEYWRYDKPIVFKYRVTSEAIAEMFESLGHPDRIKAMRTFLPNAWGYFNMILDEVF